MPILNGLAFKFTIRNKTIYDLVQQKLSKLKKHHERAQKTIIFLEKILLNKLTR